MNTQTTLKAPVLRRPDAKKTIMTVASVLGCAAIVVLCIVGWKSGIFTSPDALNSFLSSMGLWAPLIFLLIQIIQIIIPIIPGAITCSVGVIVFGPVYGFIYNYIGIVIGSFLAFLLARRYGRPLIKSLTAPKTYDKYIGWLDKSQSRFDKLFAAAIFLPFSPDDFLCMLAGVSKMKTGKLLLTLILCKPLFLLPYSFGISSITALLGGG